MHAIEITRLRRTYQAVTGVIRRKVKEIVALDGVDLSVAPGELFGLVGPNGAGKTTMVKILTTLLTPTKGQVQILGFDVDREVDQIRPRIGFMFGGERGVYWRLTGRDNLIYFANLYHVPPDVQAKRIPALLELVGLSERGDEKVQGYSRGMKQRLHIARALLHDPEILFLDEPTTGLDPVGARELRQLISDLRTQGKTVFLTTHYMFEADALCQRVAVINQGKIVALDTPSGLKRLVQDLAVVDVEVLGVPPQAIECLRALDGVSMVSVENRDQKQMLRIHARSGTAMVAPVVNALQDIGLQAENILVREPTLEDAYVRLVGGKA